MPNGGPLIPAADARLTLTTLGGWSFSYASPSQALTPVLGPSKPLALLVYLSAMPGHAARREHLADLLWADLSQDAARHALRQTLWHLRRRSGTEIVRANGDQLVLNSPVDTDRDTFLAAVEKQDHDRAVALYGGDFLPRFAAPGGAEFERWADVERFRLRSTFLRTASALVRLRLDASQFREAVALARRVRDTEPTSEAGWRLLIEALVCAGDRIGAALEADRLGQWLAAEAREPEPKTCAVVRLVTEAEEAAPRPANAPTGTQQIVPDFIGREQEFGAILGAWADASRGPARHVHITGAAGLGKTRLLLAVHTRLRAIGARCVLLRANPGDRQVSFAFAADVAAALAALPGAAAISTGAAETLVGLCPALSSRYPSARADHGTETELIRRRILALAELIASIADEAPVAVLVDDTHWADPASRQVLAGVVSRLSSDRALVVTTARPVAEGAISHARTTTLAVEPLTVGQVGALVAGLGSLPAESWADRFADRLHAASGGSPLLVLETLQLALERRLLALTDEGWGCRDAAALDAMLVEGSAVTFRVAQLPRDQMWLLMLLAVTGSPVSTAQLLTYLLRPEDAVLADLSDLEHRGLVTRIGDTWAPAHDEISAAAIDLASAEAVRAANLAVGRALAAEAERDAALLLRAAQYLALSGSVEELGVVFTKWVRHQRRRRDRRSHSAIAKEVLGEAAGPEQVAPLIRRLPLAVRIGMATPGRVAAAVALPLALLLAIGFAVLRTGPAPDVILVVPREVEPGRVRLADVPLRLSDWAERREVDIEREGREVGVMLPSGNWASASYDPSRRAWLLPVNTPDSGGQDVYLVDRRGRFERLTFSPGDDTGGDWSPDGSQFVFVTARWSEESWYAIAVMDLTAPGHPVRRVLGGERPEAYARSGPKWSPDGSRLAYERYLISEPRVGIQRDLCWAPIDGTEERCLPTHARAAFSVLRWSDPSTVLVVIGGPDSTVLARWRVDQGVLAPVRAFAGGVMVVSSADGRWFAATPGPQQDGSGSWAIFRADTPERLVPARIPSRGLAFQRISWVAPEPRNDYVARLTIGQASESIAVGTPTRLVRNAFDALGRPTDSPRLRWWSSDSATAVVDSNGVVLVRRAGTATIYATAGGWRAARVRIEGIATTSRLALAEAWTGGLAPDWRPFGAPGPVLVTAGDGRRGFLNNGDGSFSSGAYSARTFEARRGLGVEARISAPLTKVHWQVARLRLEAVADSAALRGWDHLTGDPPSLGGGSNGYSECSMTYPPADGGGETLRHIGLQAREAARHAHSTRLNSRGEWFTIRIQVLPDGRCAFAVGGQPLWIGPTPVSLDRPFRLWLDGNSSGTKILVGALEVWEGVRQDIDWAALDRTPARARQGPRATAASGSRSTR